MTIPAYKGLVAFIDILGYQNLLTKIEPEVIAEKILPILGAMKEKTTDKIRSELKSPSIIDRFELLFSKTNWVSFSDTILVTLSVDESEASKHQIFQWTAFLYMCAVLHKHLFEIGLPARGAIEYGKFVVKDSFFAGQSIVDAYKLGSKIEIATCAVSNQAYQRYLQLIAKVDPTAIDPNLLILEYLVQVKNEPEQLIPTLIWKADDEADLRSFVLKSFMAHEKDLPLAAKSKALNTEHWLEFIRLNRPKTLT